MEQMDGYDLKILAELQRDGRLTNNELSDLIALSPSQCSRRRARLESDGFIQGYRAMLDRSRAGARSHGRDRGHACDPQP